MAVSSSYGGAGKDVVVGVVTPPEDEQVVTFVAPAIKCRSSKRRQHEESRINKTGQNDHAIIPELKTKEKIRKV